MHDNSRRPVLSASLLCATLASALIGSPHFAAAAPNQPAVGEPIAIITPATAEVLTESEVLLDGRLSNVPGSEPGTGLQYEWTQVGGPPVELSSRSAPTVTFRAPLDETVLSYTLTVSGEVSGLASLPALSVITVSKRLSDFGDAPDSDNNHLGITNTAYLGVPGHFPTVWDGTPPGAPAGPNHRRPNVVWLGRQVTFPEKDADLSPDPDGVSNILNGGADVADQDLADDGWENKNSALFVDCQPTTLQVRVTRSLIPLPANMPLYLNVWFDGNRDGDWADAKTCPQTAAGQPGGVAREWIVPNFAVISPAPGGSVLITVPTQLIPNGAVASAAWLRFSLSEVRLTPVISVSASLQTHDGRGPNPPGMYQLGETEDYRRPGDDTQGQPGKVEISKTVITSGPIAVGSLMTYVVEMQHVGGTAPTAAVMTDILPSFVQLAAPPFVVVITPTAAPAVAAFTPPYIGAPSGRVNWLGTMSPGAKIAVNIPVRVRECAPNGIRNAAVVRFNTGAAESVVETPMDCQPTVPPVITVTKKLIDQLPIDSANGGLGSQAVGFELVVTSSPSPNTYTVVVSDDLPLGLLAVAATANRGVAGIINAGQTVLWTGPVGGSLPPAVIKILAKAKEQAVACDKPLINQAHWTLIDGKFEVAGTADQLGRVLSRGESNAVEVTFPCPDLGDAPDSTNHFSATMNAYPAVVARYPTVFDSPAGAAKGPKHANARPIHLGPRVSFEPEADLGWDTDGVNNLRPPPDAKDMDKFDDGLVGPPVFSDCKRSEMKVLVYRAPGVPTNTVMYLNAWIDSNRDGDWEDVRECPAEPGTTQSAVAREHFVIDYAINVGALPAGVNLVVLPTNLVAWPASSADKPAWMRLTLSERQSNKTLTASCPSSTPCFGDGRGYDDPFRLGETEDLIYRKEIINPNPTVPGDVTVIKRGSIRPETRPESITIDEGGVHLSDKAWQIDWLIEVSGADDTTTIVDTQDGQTIDLNKARIVSPRDPQSGLPTGQRLYVISQTLPITTPAGTVITNTVVVSKPTDINPDNNTAVATVTVPLPNPVIVSPEPGTTCTGTMTVTVRAIPGALVKVYGSKPEDDPAGYALLGSAPADANGVAAIAISGDLDNDGNPESSIALYATATSGSMTSGHSNLVVVAIDTSLGWDPLSLTFEDGQGHKIRPRDERGRTDATGWSIRLAPNTTYTVSVHICCSDPNASVSLTIPGVGTITLTDEDGDHIFTATFTTGDRSSTANDKSFTICVTCNLVKVCTDGTILIDPYGVVYDASVGTSALVPGALVACYQQTDPSAGSYSLWPAASFGQINPQTTSSDGAFSFFTPNGSFQLVVNKAGYQPYRSPDIVVAGTPVRYDVGLTPEVTKSVKHTILVDDNGFSPSTLQIAPGDTVEWVNADTAQHGTASSVSATHAPSAVTLNSGALETGESYRYTFANNGTYTYYDPQNANNTATITVAPPSYALYLPVHVK